MKKLVSLVCRRAGSELVSLRARAREEVYGKDTPQILIKHRLALSSPLEIKPPKVSKVTIHFFATFYFLHSNIYLLYASILFFIYLLALYYGLPRTLRCF